MIDISTPVSAHRPGRHAEWHTASSQKTRRRVSPPESADTSDMDEDGPHGVVPAEHAYLFEDPPHLVCPLSSELFLEPVIARSGRKYEREAIVRWIRQGHSDPITRVALKETELTTSFDDKSAAESYRRGTALKCVSIACDPSCGAPVVYLRRASRLILPTDIAIRGLSKDVQSYLLSHTSADYDSIALRMFARALEESGSLRDAAAVHFRMMAALAWGRDCSGPLPVAPPGSSPARSPSSPSLAEAQRKEDALEAMRQCLSCFAPGNDLGNTPAMKDVLAVVDGLCEIASRSGALPWPTLVDLVLDAMPDSRVAVCLIERLLGELRCISTPSVSGRRGRKQPQAALETVPELPSTPGPAEHLAVPLEERVQLIAKYTSLTRMEVGSTTEMVRESQAAMLDDIESIGNALARSQQGETSGGAADRAGPGAAVRRSGSGSGGRGGLGDVLRSLPWRPILVGIGCVGEVVGGPLVGKALKAAWVPILLGALDKRGGR